MAKGIKTGGRKKGTPNKVNADLRALIHGALADAGGQRYLAEQARESPAAFLTLLGKTLPKDVHLGGPDGEPLPAPQFIINPIQPKS